jgi:uncharacterized paraquat-inducible protein A
MNSELRDNAIYILTAVAAAQSAKHKQEKKLNTDSPVSAAVEQPKKSGGCSFCEKPNPMNRCARCKQAMYCSKECQVSHWKDHKSHCKAN